MVGSSTANSDSFTVTTPSDQEIRLTRLFDAPTHLVFEAMTKPEHVKEWWGRLGEGYSVPVCEIAMGAAPVERAVVNQRAEVNRKTEDRKEFDSLGFRDGRLVLNPAILPVLPSSCENFLARKEPHP